MDNVSLYLCTTVVIGVIVVYYFLTRTSIIKRRKEPYAIELKKGIWTNSIAKEKLLEHPQGNVKVVSFSFLSKFFLIQFNRPFMIISSMPQNITEKKRELDGGSWLKFMKK
jgi:hypothetical protein